MNTPCCPLCRSHLSSIVLGDNDFTYVNCHQCGLFYVNPEDRLPPEEEKLRYDLHENDPADPDYRNFLSQLFEPLNERLPARSTGLDFGSGPGPTLHLMFEKAGHSMNIFDPFYDHDPSVFDHMYDFITMTETAEHLFNPREEFEKLWSILKPGGYLGVMTKLLLHPEKFANWHYRKDDTHVAFYQTKTFKWLAGRLNAKLDIQSDRVIILKKQ